VKGERAVWVGADPGGKDNFGIAVLIDDWKTRTAIVGCADEAAAFVDRVAKGTATGIGVDAPLWWSSGRSGDRYADQWLRRRYRLSGGEVQAGNSLRGAALTQGAMFVQRIRERYPQISVTECHPKALLRAISDGRWVQFSRRFGLGKKPQNEHARDAIVAAVAARESFLGRRTHDLSEKRLAGEHDPRAYWLAPVYYFWPEV
jgi:predicted nuclease with RNAse H fold